jgi:hypothetical protein
MVSSRDLFSSRMVHWVWSWFGVVVVSHVYLYIATLCLCAPPPPLTCEQTKEPDSLERVRNAITAGVSPEILAKLSFRTVQVDEEGLTLNGKPVFA